jgi:DNA-binding transcriptional ArsR family regulator
MPDQQLARALGSRIRRNILHTLCYKELSVHNIAKKHNLSEVNASKHLKKLYDLGLLKTKTVGRERFYKLKFPETIKLLKSFDMVAKNLRK